jgi:primase-polymerase (primpol)-like protein
MKPIRVRVNQGGIPVEMQAERRWVCARSKVPFSPFALDQKASSTDPKTSGTFRGAMAAYLSNLCDGIGFVLGDGWVGLDIDDCRDPESGVIDADALRHCHALNSYTELSPSGTGLHVIAHGTKPGKRCRIGSCELYERDRYFTVTGCRVPEFPPTVEERTPEIAILYANLFGADDGRDVADVESVGTDLPDDALLEKANANPKFAALWRGDMSGYPSHSEADSAMCAMLAFWTRRDAVRMDVLFRRSGLYRPKWDRHDYRERTIAHAVALTDGVFTPDVPYCPLESDMPTESLDLNAPVEWI